MVPGDISHRMQEHSPVPVLTTRAIFFLFTIFSGM
jgi:hypothetical protein